MMNSAPSNGTSHVVVADLLPLARVVLRTPCGYAFCVRGECMCSAVGVAGTHEHTHSFPRTRKRAHASTRHVTYILACLRVLYLYEHIALYTRVLESLFSETSDTSIACSTSRSTQQSDTRTQTYTYRWNDCSSCVVSSLAATFSLTSIACISSTDMAACCGAAGGGVWELLTDMAHRAYDCAAAAILLNCGMPCVKNQGLSGDSTAAGNGSAAGVAATLAGLRALLLGTPVLGVARLAAGVVLAA